MTKFYLTVSARNDMGQMQSLKGTALPQDVQAIYDAANRKLAKVNAEMDPHPKTAKKRGRPVGYKCSPETVAQMVESRLRTLAARKADHASHAGA